MDRTFGLKNKAKSKAKTVEQEHASLVEEHQELKAKAQQQATPKK